jgi:hypothetical protein
VLYTVFGHDLLIVRIVQAAIGAMSAALLGLATWRLLTPRAGIVAGLAMALYAPAIFFDGLLQKAVLDVFFICLMPDREPPDCDAHPPHAMGRSRRHARRLSLTRENARPVLVAIAWAVSERNHEATRPRRRSRERTRPWGVRHPAFRDAA